MDAEGVENTQNTSLGTAGVFGEFPLYFKPGFYVFGEAMYLKGNPSFYRVSGTSSYFATLDLTGISPSGGIKYVPENGKRVRPFFKLGAVATVISASSPTGLVSVKAISTSDVEVLKNELSPKTYAVFGITCGTGLEFSAGRRRTMQVSLRYDKTLNTTLNNYMTLGYGGVFFIVGYSI